MLTFDTKQGMYCLQNTFCRSAYFRGNHRFTERWGSSPSAAMWRTERWQQAASQRIVWKRTGGGDGLHLLNRPSGGAAPVADGRVAGSGATDGGSGLSTRGAGLPWSGLPLGAPLFTG